MSATAASAGSDVVIFRPQTLETVDYLASLFLELERAASEKYREAYLADEPHERLKDRLIAMVSEIGSDQDGSRVLKGSHYEIKLTLGDSNYFDPCRVSSFRYALLRHGVPKGTLPEIFLGQVRFQFRESAKVLIDSLKLPGELLTQYEECRAKTPILEVRSIPR